MTDAEQRLWSALRNGRLQGFKFRRQQPIGHYIVDFFCAKARLIIELDGSQHDDEGRAWYDYRRTKWLTTKGYRVIRFRNYDVLRHPSQIIQAIALELRGPPIRLTGAAHAAPAIHLPPQGGKGCS
jgi:very-short-patch-repair endonuclease